MSRARLPASFDVTLARIGSGSFADSTARFAHHVDVLAWLLPLGGLLLIGIGVATSKDRPAAGTRAGYGVIAAGVVVGSATLALGMAANSLAERAGCGPVLVAAAWHELDGPPVVE